MLFNSLYLVAILITSPWLVCRSWKTKRYQDGWGEKWLGRVPCLDQAISQDNKSKSPVFWLHAVSVGEVQVLRSLIDAILVEWPSARIAISTTTRTGMELAKKNYAKHCLFYMPLDFTWAVRTALSRINPDWLLLAELEIWPNLVKQADAVGCRVAVINGRLSGNSFKGYRRLRWFLRPSFAKLTFVGAQDATYAQRFVSMGVESDKVHITGSLKFDGANSDRNHPEIVNRKLELRLKENDLVWVAGSTQSPEEEMILETFQSLRAHERFAKLRLILVPRHPERGEDVAKQIKLTDLDWVQRSKARRTPPVVDADSAEESANPEIGGDWDILLADTIGELRWWWGLATVAFVGGSFGSRGGQNMIEPVAYGVPTAVGPNTINFKDIMRIFVDAHAITALQTPAELESWLTTMLDDKKRREVVGNRGITVASQHRGATARTLGLMKQSASSSSFETPLELHPRVS